MSETSTITASQENINQISINNYWLWTEGLRLDARYYFENVFQAREILSKFKGVTLKDISKEIFNLTRFKRIYSQRGTPYLNASESLYFRPVINQYLATTQIQNLKRYFVKEGWILVTCSGTIGRLIIVNKKLIKFVLTHDLIRIILEESCPVGYIYAYLSTKVGQTLIQKGSYGAAVKHIEPEHIKNIKIPLVSEKTIKTINDDILKAYKYREIANSLLDLSTDILKKELNFDKINYEKEELLTFSQKSINLDYRLDASYHNMIKRRITKILEGSGIKLIKIGEVSQVFMPHRFKRIYVMKEHGIPFLQGKNLVEIKPFDLQYISTKVTKNIEDLLIHTGYILVTRSGTIGRVIVTPKQWDGWAATEHIIRIKPNTTEKYVAGYIAAFLSSKIGQILLVSKSFGAVIDEISEDHIREIEVPFLNIELQKKIGNLFIKTFELKEKANLIENNAIEKLEIILSEPKEKIILSDTKKLDVYEDSLTLSILYILNEYGILSLEEIINISEENKGKVIASIDILERNFLIKKELQNLTITEEGMMFIKNLGFNKFT